MLIPVEYIKQYLKAKIKDNLKENNIPIIHEIDDKIGLSPHLYYAFLHIEKYYIEFIYNNNRINIVIYTFYTSIDNNKLYINLSECCSFLYSNNKSNNILFNIISLNDGEKNHCLKYLVDIDRHIFNRALAFQYNYINHVLSFLLYTFLYNAKLYEINKLC